MSLSLSIAPTTPAAAIGTANASTAPADKKRLEKAATDFEGLLIAQMLRHAREAGSGGWLGSGEDQASASMTEMAEESLARSMASQGCLGLATLMTQGVLREAAPKPPPASSPANPPVPPPATAPAALPAQP